MRFAVIGPLEVRTDDLAPVAVPGAKERLLLAVLAAAAPGVVGVDRLLDTLWDGAPPVTARKSLQAHVVRLRSALEPDRPKGSTGRYVVRRGPGYALAVGREAVDALRIGDLAARGRAQLASGDAAQALQQLTAAMDLWRGEPYADWPDAPFADIERRRLAEVRAGAVAGLLETQLALGRHTDVVPELERLIAEDPLREGWWSLLMLALYRGGRQAEAMAAGRRVRALLADELGADPGPGLRGVETAILAQDPALDLPTQRTGSGEPLDEPGTRRPRPATGSCPYKGLATYQADDAPLFHGRQRLIASLVRHLVDATVLVVSGPSGAGKSSAVRAGLLPALAGGALPGSETWEPVVLTPGPRPVDALTSLTGESPPDAPVVLVCDQMEELWAPGVDPGEQSAFLDAVLGLVDDGVVVRCVAVVRGDHVGRLAEHSAFTDRLGGELVLVGPLTDPELREVVAEPARAAGLSVEPELLDAVVGDVVGQAVALPLLSTALVGTWERRRADVLTLAGYLAAGGVAGALTRSAEAVYADLDDEGRRLARQLLVRLADSDEPGLIVRRPVPLGELGLAGEGGAARQAVVEAFVRRRLLAVDSDRLEVAHEALLSAWPRLARWLEDDAVGRTVRRHLAPAALDWDRGGRPRDELYRGARLSGALDWAAAPGADVTPVERAFLDNSQAQADAELRDARERADREAAARHRTRRLAVGLAGVLVLALVAAGLAVGYQRDAADRAADAEASSTVADANRLAALSTTVGSLDLSLLLAAQAVRLSQTPETEYGLLATLVEHGRAVRVGTTGARPGGASLAGGGVLFIGYLRENKSVAWSVDSTAAPTHVTDVPGDWFSADGSPTQARLAVSGVSEADAPYVRVYSRDGRQLVSLEGDAVGGVPVTVAYTPDGQRLRWVAVPQAAGPEPTWRVLELDLASGAVTTVAAGADPSPDTSLAVDFADDGETAVLWPDGSPEAARIVDLTSGASAPLAGAPHAVASLGFDQLGTTTAQSWADGAVTLYDRSGRSFQTLDRHQAPVRVMATSPDGTWAVTAGDGGAVELWDIETGGLWSHRESLSGHDGDVYVTEIDATGRLLFTVSGHGSVIVFDVSADGGFGSSYPGLADRWISNRPQVVEPGGLIVAPTRAASHSGGDPSDPAPDTLSVAATFFDPTSGRVVDEVVVGDTLEGVFFGSSVAVSPDRRMVAVTSALATTVLDTRTREVLGRVVLPPTDDVDADGEPLPAQAVWSAGWTPDGSRLLLGAEGQVEAATGGSLVVVDPATWEVERRVDIGSAQAMEASPDGRLLAVASAAEPALHVLDATTLELQRTVPLGQDNFPYDLSFSADGRRLAVGGELGLVHVLDTTTWETVAEPVRAQAQALFQVEWMPDDRTVATAGIDETVSLHDVTSGLLRARLPASSGPGQGYTHLVPGSSEEVVALSGERDGRAYPLNPAVWLAEACAVAGRDLTEAEWSRYLPDRPHEPTCSDLG